MLNLSKNRVFFWLLFVVLTSAIAYKNQKELCVYYEYLHYKTASNNDEALAGMSNTIYYGKEAGYSCKDKQSPSIYAYEEILKKNKYVMIPNSYRVGYCVQLPTGQVILTMGNDTQIYYVLLEINGHNPESYHVLDIKGQALG